MDISHLLLYCLAAYLIGSIPYAFLISRAFHLPDPRQYGSKNPGATNVLRTGNRLAALLVLGGDLSKGWTAVWAIKSFKTLVPITTGLSTPNNLCIAGAMVSVIVGHVYPIFYKFSGGKGVATSLGALLGVDGILGSTACVLWVVIVYLTGYSSVASLTTAVASCFLSFFIIASNEIHWALVFVTILLFWRHSENIKKILKGAENSVK